MPSAWSQHPKLVGRFRPGFPDDLQVILHDGSRIISNRMPELAWVHVTGCQDDIFSGAVLNTPEQLQSVTKGAGILFMVPKGGPYPLLVTAKYLEERPTWRLLAPCKNCSMTELFDPPSRLLARSFPSVTQDQLRGGFIFTTRCGYCGDSMVVRVKRTTWPWSEENRPPGS